MKREIQIGIIKSVCVSMPFEVHCIDDGSDDSDHYAKLFKVSSKGSPNQCNLTVRTDVNNTSAMENNLFRNFC
jgi:hypothetical protein